MHDLFAQSPLHPELVWILSLAILASGIIQNGIYSILMTVAGISLVRRKVEPVAARLARGTGDDLPGVSIIVPAYNEAETIEQCVLGLLRQAYPDLEILVIDDGSSDETLNVLKSRFSLTSGLRTPLNALGHEPATEILRSASDPRLIVISKRNGGKADALNAGIEYARSPLFCAIDADSILEPDALLRSVQPFLGGSEVCAVAGTVRLANGCQIAGGLVRRINPPSNWLARIQSVEYLRAFLIARYAWSQLGALMIVSGAFGVFDRERVIEAGGYDRTTVGEDAELIVRLHRQSRDAGRPACIKFVPEPVCWTQAPKTLKDLSMQRRRWHRGALQTVNRHRSTLLNPRYGAPGVVGMGSMLLIDVAGPALEVLGYALALTLCLLGWLHWVYFAAFFAVSASFGFFLSCTAILLDQAELRRHKHGLAGMIGSAFLENFGYRQLSNIWRLQGALDFIRRKSGWGSPARQKFDDGQQVTPA